MRQLSIIATSHASSGRRGLVNTSECVTTVGSHGEPPLESVVGITSGGAHAVLNCLHAGGSADADPLELPPALMAELDNDIKQRRFSQPVSMQQTTYAYP